jgi:alpha,alpha-trehalase
MIRAEACDAVPRFPAAWSHRAVAGLLIVTAAWAHIAQAASDNSSPAQEFGELFAQVQTAGVFADSKTFPDATPRTDPATILARFHSLHPRTRAELTQFVGQYFVLPVNSPTTSVPPGQSLEGHIGALWPILTRQSVHAASYSSLLFVPQPYVVPGGRFREFYYWDSYFTMLGLGIDGHRQTAQGMVADFGYLIDRYGHIPNGARTYYLSRSQPPVFYLMVGQLSADPDGEYAKYLTQLRREHEFWMHGAHGLRHGAVRERVVVLPDGAILNRYWDGLDTPRDESYREDVLVAQTADRVPSKVYRDIRAAAESGWDFSSRWLADGKTLKSIHTTEIVPVDLNSLLFGLEQSIASGCRRAGDQACARDFSLQAERRKAAMQRYLWDPAGGRFVDYDWVQRRSTGRLSAATLYPLFVGLAEKIQADAVAKVVAEELIRAGGLVCTTTKTGQQWDAPNGWPPLQWIAVSALERYGQHDMARDLAHRWLTTVERVYAETGKLLEKYDVETIRPGGGGEYPLQDGFGWTNGVPRALLTRYPDLSGGPGTQH